MDIVSLEASAKAKGRGGNLPENVAEGTGTPVCVNVAERGVPAEGVPEFRMDVCS